MKRFFSLILTITMLCAFMPCVRAATIVDSGECGDNLVWALDNGGTLTISGTGKMYGFDPTGADAPSPPWGKHRSDIKSVIIENGVSSIGSYAFYYGYSLDILTIPGSVTRVGYYAFRSIPIRKVCYMGKKSEWNNIEMEYSGFDGRNVQCITDAKSEGQYNLDTGDTIRIDLDEDVMYEVTVALDGYENYYCDIKEDDGSGFGGSGQQTIKRTPLDGVYILTANFYTDYHQNTKINGTYTVTIKTFEKDNCGDNVYYSLSKDGTLTLSGTGTMYDNYYTPWYRYNKSITNVVIGDGITSICGRAFEGIPITSISIPNSVTAIGENAFADCASLSSVNIPDSVTAIGKQAFRNTPYYNDKYNDASNWDGSVFYLDKWIFYADPEISGNYQVKEGTIGIADKAFSECINLTGITLPDSLKGIGENAFFGCTKLASLVIPPSVVDIGMSDHLSAAYGLYEYGDYFNDGKGYESYPATVYGCADSTAEAYVLEGDYNYYMKTTFIAYETENGEASIKYCTPYDNGSSGLQILNSVEGCPITEICANAFADCDKLTDVYYNGSEAEWNALTIGNGNENLLNANIHYDSTMPFFVHEYGNYLYTLSDEEATITKRKVSADHIEIPSEINGIPVTEIGNMVFSYDSVIKSIMIPRSVTKIGSYAFAGSTNLTDVYYAGTSSDWENISIEQSNDSLLNAALHTNAIGTALPQIANANFIGATASSLACISVTLEKTEYDCEMMTVFYKGGVMADMQTMPFSTGDTDISVPVTDVDADMAKVFIWNSLNGMRPLCAAETVDLN